jgi:hypothetical protein
MKNGVCVILWSHNINLIRIINNFRTWNNLTLQNNINFLFQCCHIFMGSSQHILLVTSAKLSRQDVNFCQIGGSHHFKPFFFRLSLHYNKRCPCTPNDFTRFWVNSLVVMNEDQWKSSEFIGLVNGDQWTTPTFCNSGVSVGIIVSKAPFFQPHSNQLIP